MALSGAHLIGLVVLVLLLVVRRAQRQLELRKLATAHGCKPIRPAHNKLPLGLDRKHKILTHKGNPLDDLLTTRFKEVGGWLYQDASWTENTPILCAEPEALKAILATSFKDWSMEPYRLAALSPWIGTGIFNSSHDGAHSPWAAARSLIRPSFARDDIYDLSLLERDVQHFFEALGTGADGWTAAPNLHPLIRRFSLDTITTFFCGGCVEAQRNSLAPAAAKTPAAQLSADLENAFDECNRVAAMRFKVPPLYWLFNPRSFQEACRHVKAFGLSRVDQAIAQVKAAGAGADADIAAADVLQYLASKTGDRVLMRDVVSQMVFAGVDTTTSMLGFTLLELARTPGGWARLRAELAADGMGGDDPAALSAPKLKSCRFLQNCLAETLRLYPGIPFNSRHAVRDTVLPVGGGPDGRDPVLVPRGTVVRYSVYVMHRREDLYGPDALQWNPDRWNGRRHDWSYAPFSGGPRICLGQKFSLIEGAYCLARFAQHFDQVEGVLPPRDAPVPSRVDTALFPQQGVPLRFRLTKRE
ncbi:hypothetical protein NKR23_g12354 [Pleurostoma richardsiae]|uniref:Cytochrome P450 n=1 Tax=Pleurostoma richardsiae TaxID=41990 RepID=A0AA38VFL3_9PEZI|nr:hypothetical protein NKR23_g12354 [Pleurostoma richardsiae]